MTDTSSVFKNPSSLAGVSSAQLEIQLNYLAKELELERLRREKLQKQVEEMQENLNRQRIESEREVEKFRNEKEQREKNVKIPNMDLDDPRVLQKGFFSFQWANGFKNLLNLIIIHGWQKDALASDAHL